MRENKFKITKEELLRKGIVVVKVLGIITFFKTRTFDEIQSVFTNVESSEIKKALEVLLEHDFINYNKGEGKYIANITQDEYDEYFDRKQEIIDLKQLAAQKNLKRIDCMDELLPLALRLIMEQNNGIVSVTAIQRRMGIGYPRAARIRDQIEEMGIISDEPPYQVRITKDEFQEFFRDKVIWRINVPPDKVFMRDLAHIVPADILEAENGLEEYYKKLGVPDPRTMIIKNPSHNGSTLSYLKDAYPRNNLNIEDLKLDNISFYNIRNKRLTQNQDFDIRNIVYEALNGEEFSIALDLRGMKEFLEEHDYKVHVAKLFLDEDLEQNKFNIPKQKDVIYIIKVQNGFDFSLLMQLSEKINNVFGEGYFAIQGVEKCKRNTLLILY